MSDQDPMEGLAALSGEEEQTAPPPVPGEVLEDGTVYEEPKARPSSIDDLSFDDKLKLKENLLAQQEAMRQQLEILERETEEMDGVSFCEHALGIVNEIERIINPIRLGGDVTPENAPFLKLEELRQWLTQGITLMKVEETESPS